jgi:O-glycosyl hydrolase
MSARTRSLFILLGLLGTFGFAGATLRAQTTITIDPAVQRQQFHGFGVGTIFFQGHLAQGVPPAFRVSTYDLLFRDVPHRYHMLWFRPNEATNDNANPYLVNWGGFTFGSGQDEYVTVFRESVARNSNVVVMATVYTPPAWMKTNRSETDGGTLDPTVPDVYAEFAEFVFANLHWFWQRGVRVSVLTLMNEPDYTLTHEDADFTAAQARDVHRLTVPLLRSLIAGTQNTAGVVMPQIMGPSTLSVTAAASYVDTLKANTTAWTNTHVISTHQYGGASEANFATLVSKAEGKPVIMSEWHSANNDDIDPEDVEVVEQGRAIATAINGGVNGYLWFESNHPGNGFAGLIHLPWWDTDGPNVMKTYHSWKQWAQLTPWDARRLGVTTTTLPASLEGVVAFQTPGASNLVVHVVKSGSSLDSLLFRVPGHSIMRVERFVTSATQAFVRTQDVSTPAGWTEFPAQLQSNQLASFRLTLAPAVTLIAAGSTWRYFDQTNNLGAAWRSNSFNDGAWSSGPAMLGFGDANGLLPSTVVASNRQLTTYFRQTFVVPPGLNATNLNLRILRDDAAVVYLDGAEIWRDTNITTGVVAYNTLAPASLNGASESTWLTTNLPPSLLPAGPHLLAVEVHQNTTTSSDVSFHLELTAQSAARQPSLVPVRVGGNQFALAWPDWAGGFTLRATTNLTPPVAWTPVTNTPVLTSNEWRVTLPIATNGQRFFRLQTP